MNEVLIGTSGYDYPEWKGVFYPENLPRKDFLSYYSTKFNALELNYSFYSMPKKEQMNEFLLRSEEKIQFSVKANRLLTHEINSNWKTVAKDFMQTADVLRQKEKLCAVLFQFPQSFHYTPQNRFYLADLITEFNGFPAVIEFRHKEWIRQSVFEGLEQRNASVAFCDMPALKALPAMNGDEKIYSQFIGPVAYIRMHGRNADAWYCNDAFSLNKNSAQKNVPDRTNGSARYDYDYSDEELTKLLSDKEYSLKVLGIERGNAKPRKDIAKWSDVKENIEYMYDDKFLNKENEYPYQVISDKESIEKILKLYMEKYYDENADKQTWFDNIKELAGEMGYAKEVKEFKANPDAYKAHVGDVSTVLRIALTGRTNTPDMYEIMQVLGKDSIEKRFDLAIKNLK